MTFPPPMVVESVVLTGIGTVDTDTQSLTGNLAIDVAGWVHVAADHVVQTGFEPPARIPFPVSLSPTMARMIRWEVPRDAR